MSIELQVVGHLKQGGDLTAAHVDLNGLQFTVLSFGASLQDLRLQGHNQPLVLGYKDPLDYEDNPAYLGSMVGRCANRIANGTCELNGRQLLLNKAEGHAHHLHGGPDGSSQRNWHMTIEQDKLVLTDRLPDGHMGYPGNLDVKVSYSVPTEGRLRVEIAAQSDADTLCNFTPHWYFNLAEASLNNVSLQVHADAYLPTENGGIPVVNPVTVEGSYYDLRNGQLLSAELLSTLDHNYCIAETRGAITQVASLSSAALCIDVFSTEPGLQVYGGEYLHVAANETLTGLAYGAGAGIALEPQCWPDGLNHKCFPDVILKANEHYCHVTEYQIKQFGSGTI